MADHLALLSAGARRLEQILLPIAALDRNTVTYGRVAEPMGGISPRFDVKVYLKELNTARDAAGLPDIGCVVVRQDTGEVGPGWYDWQHGGMRRDPVAAREIIRAWARAQTAAPV